MTADTDQLRRYAAAADAPTADSETAFAGFVERRIGLVYAAALRQTAGNAHLAEEITQAVFLVVSQKAATLSRHAHLSGWLYSTTTHIARRAVRDARLRRQREQEAFAMNELLNDNANATTATRPSENAALMRDALDEVLGHLGASDREIVLLRYFDALNFPEIAAHLRINEDTARKRISRALDRMRTLFARRGVASTAAALGTLLTAEAAAAAPAGLAGTVTGAILAGATTTIATTAATATATTSILALMSTAKTAITITAIIAALATATIALRETQRTHAATDALSAAQTEHTALLKQITDAERLARIQAAAQAASETPQNADAQSLAALNDPAAAGEAFLAAHPEVREKLLAMHQAQMSGLDYLACLNFGFDAAQRAEYEKLRSEYPNGFTLPPTNGYPKMLLSTSLKVDDSPEAIQKRTAKFDAFYGSPETAKQWSDFQRLNGCALPITMPLAQSLYYTDTPLTADQARQLADLYSQYTHTNPELLIKTDDWDTFVEQSRPFLSQPQLDALATLKENIKLKSYYYTQQQGDDGGKSK